jgi:hypothetical protein
MDHDRHGGWLRRPVAPAGPTLHSTRASGGVVPDCTLQVLSFARTGGSLAVDVRLTNDASGESTQVKVPITSLQQRGTYLDLTLGPIDLFLPGLRVQTDQIHLVVTAQRGTPLGDPLAGPRSRAQPLRGTTSNWLAVNARREPAGTAGDAADPPPAGVRAGRAGRLRGGASIAALVLLVLGAAVQIAWIGGLAWIVVQVAR